MPADISNKSATSHRSSYAVSMKEARNQARLLSILNLSKTDEYLFVLLSKELSTKCC